MKKIDSIFFILLVLSNFLAWYALYSTTKETPEDIKLNEEVYKQDSIKNLLDTTYFFDHSQIK